ncbi:uncharacterized protein LOC118756766, partial [Rhagoletis pomonella]|uniref:uncharacterized protein LOC118756766 n=1 Tax=Rhagoletis pomonella TaxID=28610 RepID=UPI00177E50C5
MEKMDPDEAQRDTRSEIEDTYVAIKVCIKEQLGADAHNTTVADASPCVSHSTSMKLPRLALPTFDGKYSDYKNFVTSFKQVIDSQPSLSSIEKFNQLLNCLKGAALETVKAFQISSENYPKALERLKARYDNPTLVFLDNIKSLFSLPNVSKSNAQHLRSLIDNASALYNSLLSLGSESQIAQAMLISIVMDKVDQDTRKKWNEFLDFRDLPTWTSCISVVERRCQYLESIAHNDDTAHTDTCLNRIILATALVQIKDATGPYRIGRALLDSCSQVNFISDEFAQTLRLPRKRSNLEIRSIGESQTQVKHRTSTTIKSRFVELELPLGFCVTSHIAYHPESEIDISSWNLPKNTLLADENFNKSRRIDLLLGTEAFFDILSVGYALSLDESINQNVERLWRIEDVRTPADTYTPEQRKCEEIFITTVRRQNDGRIVVRLPFKDNPCLLGRSYETARRRFEALERRLSRTPDIKRQYIDFMVEFQRLGHMSLPNSTSTKLRVVFDASCQTTSQKSLNDLLMVGPTIQLELYTLLFRFRLYRYAITADIVIMFRQVVVDDKDRQFQYVLWRNTPNEPLCTYELNTVTYKTAAAPYLAIRSMSYLADQYLDKFKIGAEAIKSCFYVDDFICGANTIDTLREIKTEVTEVLRRGRFELAKWHSNYIEFVDDCTIKELNLDDKAITSTLGLRWNQQEDVFMFSLVPKQTFNVVSKRSILSVTSSLFDPLGLVSPVIIVAKIILQELWLLRLQWDESVPHNIHTAWISFLSSLSSLELLKIPRFCLQPNAGSLQLHGFCDASIRAYGCCIYARTVSADGKVKVNLVTSKSRVAPTRKLSLPKLELCGSHLLAQLFAKIKVNFADHKYSTFLWSDSQIVLFWIQQHSATLSTFVGNRISEIQEQTSSCHWKYVPTRCNPADLLSRGCSVDELNQSMWFEGPAYLLQHQDEWPTQRPGDIDQNIVDSEKRKSAFAVTSVTNYLLEVIYNISSHSRCLLIVAWMLRFSYISRKLCSFDTPSPSPQELLRAMHCIIWNLQTKYFTDDIQALRKGREVSGHLKFLNPFLQVTEGFMLLKVGGRLELANVQYTQKHPILLP